MTVAELIAKLQHCPRDARVVRPWTCGFVVVDVVSVQSMTPEDEAASLADFNHPWLAIQPTGAPAEEVVIVG